MKLPNIIKWLLIQAGEITEPTMHDQLADMNDDNINILDLDKLVKTKYLLGKPSVSFE